MLTDELRKILDSIEYELTHGACIVDKSRVASEIRALFPDADAAHEKGKTELAVSLGLYENELGFCEISNHVPYSSLKE